MEVTHHITLAILWILSVYTDIIEGRFILAVEEDEI